jgi:integrase/recombinase XerD
MLQKKRTSVSQKAKQLAKYFRQERADYFYLRDVFKCLREELQIVVARKPKLLPYVPTEAEIKRYYEVVWQSQNRHHMVMIKTLLYTGVRISEFVNIKLEDVDFEYCQIRIRNGKGNKDRRVPFPTAFKETLALHADNIHKQGAVYLFESSWKKSYSDRGIRKILSHYTHLAELPQSVSPHKLRHFLFTWLKKQGIDDALIQPYSGHESRQSLEIYSRLSIGDAQKEYNAAIGKFPV